MVIENGPYGYIRHPMYAAESFMVIDLGLALQSWVALLVVLVLVGVVYAIRIRQEERLLASRLGNNYVDYVKRTKRIIPYIW